jgi:exodeoxyribonuclease-3
MQSTKADAAFQRPAGEVIKVVSWNINGWRAATKRGFLRWLQGSRPDIVCLQEIRLSRAEPAAPTLCIPEYHCEWRMSQIPGYSGTAILSRVPPLATYDTGISVLDSEGRTLVADFPGFVVINVYVPNGNRNAERLAFKHAFLSALVHYAASASSRFGKPIVICGDFNTAHSPIDVANSSRVAGKSGFLASERELIDALVDTGFVDSYRAQHPHRSDSFTWWAAHSDARSRNVGWRFDYIFIARQQLSQLTSARIHSRIRISDHCPASIRLTT